MRVAIVDVGSNTARLLVADVQGDRVVPLIEEREHLPLGAEIADTGLLSPGTLRDLAQVCEEYARLARRSEIARATTIVTAPGRQGRSAPRLLRVLSDATGFRVRVLSAGEEGRYAYAGAVCAARGVLPESVAVVDVGGGSTEIAVGKPGTDALWVRSIDLGSVRLTSAELTSDPPGRRELKRARALVQAELSRFEPPPSELGLVAGGSARALAKVVGRVFAADDVDEAIRILARRPYARAARAFGIHPVRAASLIGGAILLAETSRLLDRPLEVARGGVREGAALALAAAEVAAAA
jgi:exopolyphosphatase / guanosine-5'-triphosphate,3'-diphosphate pyrophosphatase